MTLESEFKLAFVIDNLKVYRCNRCVSLVLWRDRLEHRQKAHTAPFNQSVLTDNIRKVMEELYGNQHLRSTTPKGTIDEQADAEDRDSRESGSAEDATPGELDVDPDGTEAGS